MLNNIEDLKHAFYINLIHREDRKEKVIKQFEKLNIPINRFNAIQNNNGAIGCYLSHIKCLMLAKENNWEHILIVEDDIYFLNIEEFKKNLNNFLETQTHFDVLLISGNNFKPYIQINENSIKITNCQTTTGYIVKNHYYDTLINHLKIGFGHLIKYPSLHRFYAIDIWWKFLQKKDSWFLLIPILVVQEEGYSDIEKKNTNYFSSMIHYNK
jgi:glycosyl transferase family 25